MEDSAHFLLRSTGWEVLLWLSKSLELSSPCWKGSDFFFFLVIHGKILQLWKRPDQQGGKRNILLAISPSPLEKGQQTWRMPLHLGQSPAQEGSTVLWSLTWYHSYHCPEAAKGAPLRGSISVPFPSVCCRAPDRPLVHLPCAIKKAVQQLQLFTYLPWIWTQRWKTFCILLLHPWAILMPWISFFK